MGALAGLRERSILMPVYSIDTNPDRVAYGTAIGILLLNTRFPMIPGDVGNASTFKFPIVYRIVESLPTDFYASDTAFEQLPTVIREARALEQFGVAAITSDCGYMALYQKEVAEAVNVPVFLTSLMQVPFIHRTLGPGKRVGIVVADSRCMTKRLLSNAGVDDSIPIAIAGMENDPAFWSAIRDENGTLDSDAVERGAVTVARELVRRNPDIGALLLECSDLPPYAAAIQEAIRLPVFDFITMINHVYYALAQARYVGTMY
jgi:hypothetical protein